MPTSTENADPLSPETAALAAAVLEISRFVGDAAVPAPRWYALLRSAELLAQSPALASLLGDEAAAAMADDPLHLTSVELEANPETSPPGANHDADRGADDASVDPHEATASVLWPAEAVGGAVACELPAGSWTAPGAANSTGLDPHAPLRATVGVLVDGTRWTVLRTPGAEDAVMGEALLPELTEALAANFADAAD